MGRRSGRTSPVRPSFSTGISTTHGGCRTISTSCSRPFGKRRLPTSTENTRPLKVIGIVLAQLVEHALQIVGQRTLELHPSPIRRARERQPPRVQERPI